MTATKGKLSVVICYSSKKGCELVPEDWQDNRQRWGQNTQEAGTVYPKALMLESTRHVGRPVGMCGSLQKMDMVLHFPVSSLQGN